MAISANPDLRRVDTVAGGIQRFLQSEGETKEGTQQLCSLLNRVSSGSLREIDQVITELRLLREKLQSDGTRVQQELAYYAALAESTLQSTKVISESLRDQFPRPL